MIKPWMVALATAAALANACGGKAVVDGPPGSGGSGSGANGSGANGSGGRSSGLGGSTISGEVVCQTPDPSPPVSVCSGTGSSETGSTQCISVLCDGNGNTWESDCSARGCICRFNGEQACTCVVNSGTLCSGTPSCCPSPFPG